ncbi:uncharacterized protein LOC132163758 [Corylus avellana]|uniref:uncharacterized protein LOC132163758 n=1 Tax=Corylus avellana TaxID=13451 RepID=UPI00286D3713|nr:uncharacterized protein LOC132163758 [Corylus avellana]
MDVQTEVVNQSLGALLRSLVGEHLKSCYQQLYQAEFAYNPSVNWSTSLSLFTIIYGSNPRAPLDLAPLPDLKRIDTKAEDLIVHIQEGHKLTIKNLEESKAKYKVDADKKRRALEFEEGDFVAAGNALSEYNKLAARNIGLVEIVKKINPNAYHLKLPSHIKTSDVFNVKHLVPFMKDSSEEDANSRANSIQPGENDIDYNAREYMWKTRMDDCVKTPQKMVARS